MLQDQLTAPTLLPLPSLTLTDHAYWSCFKVLFMYLRGWIRLPTSWGTRIVDENFLDTFLDNGLVNLEVFSGLGSRWISCSSGLPGFDRYDVDGINASSRSPIEVIGIFWRHFFPRNCMNVFSVSGLFFQFYNVFRRHMSCTSCETLGYTTLWTHLHFLSLHHLRILGRLTHQTLWLVNVILIFARSDCY